MLDPGQIDGGQTLPASSHLGHKAGYTPTMPKTTVRELLMLRRHMCPSEQKWTRPPDDDAPEQKLKCPKLEAGDGGQQLFGPPAPVNPAASVLQQRPSGQSGASSDAQLTLFHWQIQQEERKVERLSVEQLNAQDTDGDTFLHIAVAQGKRALAYVLASKTAKCGTLDAKEHNGQTALQIAAATDQHLIALDLLKHGARIDTRDLWGRSPLHVCAEKGHVLSLQSIWRFLTESGRHIDADMFNYDGLTPLHAAVLSHNAVVKEMRAMENPCAYMAAELGKQKQTYVGCVRTLLLMGASCEARDLKSGRNCLHMAAEEANVELLHIFLNQPSALSVVNAQTFSGNTALHIVSSLQGHPAQVEAVRLLMRRGADPGARNIENELPCQLAPENPLGEKVRQSLKGKRVNT